MLPKARGREQLMYASDLLLVTDPELRAICHEFARKVAGLLNPTRDCLGHTPYLTAVPAEG